MSLKDSQSAVFKLKVFHNEVSPGINFREQSFSKYSSGGKTAELNNIEVNKVEDISHIHVVQVNSYGVFRVFRCYTVDIYMLIVVLYGEIIHHKVFFSIHHIRWFYGPYSVSYGNVRCVYSQVNRILVVVRFKELRTAVQRSHESHILVLVVVIP